MNTQPSLPDDEVKKYMNFEAVVHAHKIQRASAQMGLKAALFVAGTSVVLLVTILLWPKEPLSNPSPAKSMESPMITPATTDSIEKSQSAAQQVTEAETPIPPKSKETKTAEPKATEENQVKPEPKLEKQVIPYVQAEPVNGYAHLYEYFAKEVRYPEDAVKDSIQGVVSVTFVINATGKAEQIKIQNSLGELFDKEASRLIENMPAWKPAELNGKAVASKMSMPITFRVGANKPE